MRYEMKIMHRCAFTLIVLAVSVCLWFCSEKNDAFIKTESIIKSNALQPVLSQDFQSAITGFSEKLEKDVAEDNIGGLSVGIFVQDALIWSKGFGIADRERDVPVSADHIFRVGSITKSFTAVLMMYMVEKGIIELDDPVEEYLPEISGLKNRLKGLQPVTFRQLASHTGGLVREPDLPGAASGPVERWAEKTLECIPYTAYQSVPGTEFSYSNIGYALLGLALSRAAGEPYEQLLHDYVLKPLDMNDSFLVLTPEFEPWLASGYRVGKDGSIDAAQPYIEHRGRGYKMPNGALYSTVADLAKYLSFISGARQVKLISDATRRDMLTPQTPLGEYALGFRISKDDKGFTTIWHGGSVAGYNALVMFEPVTKVGVIMLRNYKGGKIDLRLRAKALLQNLIE